MIQTLFGSTEQKPSFLDRMKQAVTRTRENLTDRIEEAVSFNKEIDRATLDDLEGILLGADIGSATTQEVLGKLREKVDRKQIRDAEELKRILKEELLAILSGRQYTARRETRWPSRSNPGRRSQWYGENNYDRQARSILRFGRENGPTLCGRYFSCRGHRSTRSVGPSHRHGSHPHQARRGSVSRALRCPAGWHGTP